MTPVRWCRVLAILPALWLSACEQATLPPRSDPPRPLDMDILDAPPGRHGGRFIQSMGQPPRTFNPLAVEDIYSSRTVGLLMAALTNVDPTDGEVVPGLARDWVRSDGGRVLTLRLRRGLRWSDGEPLTSRDVMFTLNAIFDERVPNRYKQQLTIGGERLRYRAPDDDTVVVETVVPYAPLEYDLASINILPAHKLRDALENGRLIEAWSLSTAIREPATLVGSGPFRLLEFRPGERMTLVPNPHYWREDRAGQRLPYIDSLIVRFVANANTETVLFATGLTDTATVSVGDVAWVTAAEDTYDFTVYEQGPDTGIGFIWFNQNPESNDAGKPYLAPHKLAWFTDVNFRRAMLWGLDREGLIDAVYFGRGKPLDSMISPGNPRWHNPDVRRYRYNPDRARAALAESGFTWNAAGQLEDREGNRVAFELLAYEGSQRATALVTAFQEGCRALGIDVTLRFVDFGTLVDLTSKRFDYDAAILGLTGGGDPSGGKAIYRSDGRLHVWYPNQSAPATEWEARIDALMDAQEQALDPAERVRLVHEIQAIFAEQLPLLFLVTPTAYGGIGNEWRNLRIPPGGPIAWNIAELWTTEAPP